jgi:ATP-binding cassette, subfamily B, bacterial PglK
MNYIQKIHQLLDKKTKRQLFGLIVFSIFVSVVETLGISAIMPFIDVATNFDVIQVNEYYQRLFIFFNFKREVDFAIVFGVVLFGFYIFRGGVNLLYSYFIAYFSQNLYAAITKKIFTVYLQMPYQIFVRKNSSYLSKTIITEAANLSGVVGSVLLMVSEVFIILFLYILMLAVNWEVTLVFTVILIIKLLFLTKTISKKIKIAGITRAETQMQFYETINRVFGNFKHIKLQDKVRLDALENEFSQTVNQYAKANITGDFLSAFPRYFLETSGFSLIILLLVFLLYTSQNNILHILPTLSLFVLALYRLLPSVNRIVSGYVSLVYYYKTVDIINTELQIDQEKLLNKEIVFNKNIVLEKIGFSYQNENILLDVNLNIRKGEKIAFIGESGAGKSTLVDLIIGLYSPNKGRIKIDGITLGKSNLRNWRSKIGYISQQVYLFDGTVLDNVCFGREVDKILLERVLKQANILEFLKTKQGLETLVGEGGIQLSGGQKQRIAIARALYGSPEILILDEATSALDAKTEQKIMQEIYKISENKTLIIIAHRLGTIKGCNKVYQLKNGIVNVYSEN